MPATLSIITNVFPREERAKAIGIWAGTAAIGVGLGPLIGGLLLEWFDWSSVFLVNVPVALVAFVAGAQLVPESRDPEPGPLRRPRRAAVDRRPGRARLRASSRRPSAAGPSPLILGCFGGALALGAAFVRWELRTAQPMLDLAFFRNPRFSIALAGDQPRVLLAVRRDLRAHAVPAVRQGLLGAGGRRGDGAARLRPHDRRARSGTKLDEQLGTTHVVAAGLLGLGRAAGDDTALDARHALLADRPVVLRRRALDGLRSWGRRPTRSWARCPRRRRASPRR